MDVCPTCGKQAGEAQLPDPCTDIGYHRPPFAGGGFIAVPTQGDIRALWDYIRGLEERLEALENG